MIKVTVPASSANIGPGFDCLGLAINIFNVFYFEQSDTIKMEGFLEKYTKSNLVLDAVKYIYSKAKINFLGVKIKIETNIPIGRGLGSSTTCIVGGMLGANALLGNPYTIDEVFEFASRLEQHPDNVAPALYGGVTVSYMDDEKIHTSKIKMKELCNFVLLIPHFHLSTDEARIVLPNNIEYKSAVRNFSRIALLMTALYEGKWGYLREALNDECHQPYRGKLIEKYDEVMNELHQLKIYGAYLSGAGPSIMVMYDGSVDTLKAINGVCPNLWETKKVKLWLEGAKIESI